MKTSFTPFAARLKLLRGKENQGRFADKLELKQGSYSRYETGEREPDLRTLCQIAKFTGVSADWLLGLADVARPGGVSVKAGDGSAIASESPGAYVQAGATSAHDSDQPQIARLLSIIESQQRVIESLSTKKG
jgi:transcriptional regulator with XRE-family HTH domain